MEEKLDLLNKKIAEIASLNGIQALLDWDQQVNMPPGGVEDRSNQAALIGELIHHRSTSPELGQLIEDLAKEIGDLDAEDDAARIVRQAKRNYDLLTKIPVEKMVEFIKLTTQAHEVWVKARQTNDFSLYQPVLQRIIELKQEQANFYKPYDHIYDPLLDMFEPGMKTAEVQEIFATLRKEQVALLKEIAQAPQVDNSFIKENYNKDLQEKFSKHVISKFGYDWQRGRLDLAPHPFTTEFGHGDVRITTRYLDNDGLSALFSTMHEAGHAMYEQGLNPIYYTTSLAGGTSLAFHESQSRMWENLVGRSKEFWSFFYPSFQMLFPEHLEEVPFERFYKGINRVAPSLIRVEADEATYNLHIMLRLELEIALLEGSLQVGDLPQVWNRKMEEYLGVVPAKDSEGVLQDVHWSGGMLGYFPTYALGNLVSAQLWEKMQEDIPNLDGQISQGKFDELLGWLRVNIHQHGAKFEPQVLIKRVTGTTISPEPFMKYLRNKYSEIYKL